MIDPDTGPGDLTLAYVLVGLALTALTAAVAAVVVTALSRTDGCCSPACSAS